MPVLSNPYRSLPSTSFWRKSVASTDLGDFDPVLDVPFTIRPDEPVATAGSCFAQHISKRLASRGFRFLQEEPPAGPDEPAFSARYGNVYTTRQLRQLFDRAYGLFLPRDNWLRKASGVYLDPFRPQLFPDGFASPEAVLEERRDHFAAVRRVFENCSVFVFTLGLTETWLSELDGAAFPVCPGTVADEAERSSGVFANLTAPEMIDDLRATLAKMREVNPGVRWILTVSPVPLIASYEANHALVSNTYSKAALRVVAQTVSETEEGVVYFPSYEMIAGPQARSSYYGDDLRSVRQEGVDAVMRVFERRYFGSGAAAPTDRPSRTPAARALSSGLGVVAPREFSGVICDEEALESEVG